MTTHKTKDERRRQIMDAAISCFAAEGYYEASMDDIARAAKLSKGSLYWHFANKRDLFRSLIETWQAEMVEGLPEAMAACGTCAERLMVLADSMKKTVAVRPELARAQLEFMAQVARDPEMKDWLRRIYAEQRQFLSGIYAEGVRAGEFRPLPVDAVARLLMAYVDGTLLQREVNDIGDDLGVLIDEMKTMLMALLKA